MGDYAPLWVRVFNADKESAERIVAFFAQYGLYPDPYGEGMLDTDGLVCDEARIGLMTAGCGDQESLLDQFLRYWWEATIVAIQDPGCGYPGEWVAHTPLLGTVVRPCDGSGEISLSWPEILTMTNGGQVDSLHSLHHAFALPWVREIERLDAEARARISQ